MASALSVTDNRITLSGAWNTRNLTTLPKVVKLKGHKRLEIDASGIEEFDTAGALLLSQYCNDLKKQDVDCTLKGLKSEWQSLLNLITQNPPPREVTLPKKHFAFFAAVGRETINKWANFFHFFDFIGRMACTGIQILKKPKRLHLPAIINTMDYNGVQALAIVGLLCFLIGVVLAYQLGAQLRTYGANIFIVYVTGVAMLREFAPLITAIILAGRTSSAFTAEIGTMKVNQEVDALLTMGLSPTEFLIVPKVLGMLIIFPFLIFWGDLFGVLGSMVMAKASLGVNYYSFLTEFGRTVELKQFLIGLSKAPVFALIIAMVGCYQGFQVEGSADSVGKKTTKSVVQAIFLIIIADAAFSILYSMLGL